MPRSLTMTWHDGCGASELSCTSTSRAMEYNVEQLEELMSLVDALGTGILLMYQLVPVGRGRSISCLLYTSDAADEEDSVDLGGRRIIKKKKIKQKRGIGGR